MGNGSGLSANALTYFRRNLDMDSETAQSFYDWMRNEFVSSIQGNAGEPILRRGFRKLGNTVDFVWSYQEGEGQEVWVRVCVSLCDGWKIESSTLVKKEDFNRQSDDEDNGKVHRFRIDLSDHNKPIALPALKK